MTAHRTLGRLAVVAAVTASGCGTRDLDFVRDDRISITRPADNAAVELPFDLRWRSEEFDGTFAVFFDRVPMGPGEDLRSLVPRDDGVCRANPHCPDADWLAARGIYVTDRPELTVRSMPDNRSNRHEDDRHEAVIVLLDANGRRVRESAFIREFVVDRGE